MSCLVIAGFGEKETFPSLVSFEIESIVNDSLKYRAGKNCAITFANTAYVAPFAQEDVVATFVEGVDPSYQSLVDALLSETLNSYPDEIVKHLTSLTKKQKDKLLKKLRKFGNKTQTEFGSRLGNDRKERHIDPLVDVVEVLPKDELAGMAESLVNLTCLKRKMSLGEETVGGPIDVAVISKGEGLVWFRRKHYFNKELNPQFFARYIKPI